MKGYKAFEVYNGNLKCKNFFFKVGETYTHEGDVKLCKSGFHFCLNPVDCFNYYAKNDCVALCEVEAYEVSEETREDSKRVCGIIKIVRQLSNELVNELVNCGKGNTGVGNTSNSNSGDCNSGDCNSGDCNSGNNNSGNRNSGDCNSGDCNSGNNNSGNNNSGNRNSGDCNSGNRNSGNRNSGNGNSGDFNSCNFSSGFFNSKPETIRCFNKHTGLTHEEFITKYSWPYVDLDLSLPYKDAWQKWWSEAGKPNKSCIINNPWFDDEVFFEITGIRV